MSQQSEPRTPQLDTFVAALFKAHGLMPFTSNPLMSDVDAVREFLTPSQQDGESFFIIARAIHMDTGEQRLLPGFAFILDAALQMLARKYSAQAQISEVQKKGFRIYLVIALMICIKNVYAEEKKLSWQEMLDSLWPPEDEFDVLRHKSMWLEGDFLSMIDWAVPLTSSDKLKVAVASAFDNEQLYKDFLQQADIAEVTQAEVVELSQVDALTKKQTENSASDAVEEILIKQQLLPQKLHTHLQKTINGLLTRGATWETPKVQALNTLASYIGLTFLYPGKIPSAEQLQTILLLAARICKHNRGWGIRTSEAYREFKQFLVESESTLQALDISLSTDDLARFQYQKRTVTLARFSKAVFAKEDTDARNDIVDDYVQHAAVAEKTSRPATSHRNVYF